MVKEHTGFCEPSVHRSYMNTCKPTGIFNCSALPLWQGYFRRTGRLVIYYPHAIGIRVEERGGPHARGNIHPSSGCRVKCVAAMKHVAAR